jgi:hypothetical protein
MKFYYSKRINYKSYFKKLIKPLKAILYFSIPVGSIYGFLKLFEGTSKGIELFLDNKIVSIIFLILFLIPMAILIFSLLYYLCKITYLYAKDILLKVKSYKKLYSAWRTETYKNNEIYIPILKIPTYNYFTQEFKHESKILKYIYFDIESISNIPFDENWNVKIALGEFRDIFYVIYHTIVSDKNKFMNIAIENKDLGDDRQLKTTTRFNESRLPLLELYIDDCEEEEYKKIRLREGDNEIKVVNREEKIKAGNLHNLRLEIWASNAIRGKNVLVDAIIKNICISWQ